MIFPGNNLKSSHTRSRLDSLQDMLSPPLLGSLGLLAVFPLLARGLVALIRGWRRSSKVNPG